MRETVSMRIRTDLLARAKEFHLVLDDVSITHLSFGKVRLYIYICVCVCVCMCVCVCVYIYIYIHTHIYI